MAGIYIHIPFCKQACSYCDFHFSTSVEKNRVEMIAAIQKELANRSSELEAIPVKTIYFGGGTPSLLDGEEVEALLSTISSSYTLDKVLEITLESNPDDITTDKLLAWKKAGINRLSIGVQSFMQRDLEWMNRAHNADESESAIQLAKKHGFLLTIDLMYGLPYASLADWEHNINKAIDLAPAHISAYCLTIEQQTALDKWIKMGKIEEVSEEDQVEQFVMLVEKLKTAGYEQYEISNFAKEGQYALHNTNYWRGVKYLGVGPSAHSFDGVKRRWNIANNPQYVKKIQNEDSYFETETLSPADRFNEYIMTGLRTKWGIDLEKLEEIISIPKAIGTQIDDFEKQGLVKCTHQNITLTSTGKLVADQIASELFLVNQ